MNILSNAEALQSLQDSISSAESIYDDYGIVFASETQVVGINIALRKIIPNISREDRIATLRILFSRQRGLFHSSKDITMAGAKALRDRIYGPNALVNKDSQMLDEAVQGVREAYRMVCNERELTEEWHERM